MSKQIKLFVSCDLFPVMKFSILLDKEWPDTDCMVDTKVAQAVANTFMNSRSYKVNILKVVQETRTF